MIVQCHVLNRLVCGIAVRRCYEPLLLHIDICEFKLTSAPSGRAASSKAVIAGAVRLL